MTKASKLLEIDDASFNYRLLGRLWSDNDSLLASPHPSEKTLWAGSVKDQIKEMKKLYKKLAVKPEWLTLKDIDNYEREMIARLKETR